MERRVAFVTGASRGIGKAAAIALAEAGYDVVVTARTVEEGEKYDYSPTVAQSREQAMPGSIQITAAEVRQRGRQALPIRLDLLDRGTIDAALAQTVREWGHIDLLLNNGIYEGPGVMEPFLNLTDAMLAKIFAGNVFAPIHITQTVLPAMLSRGGGTIINMTSGAGTTDPPNPVGAGGWGFAYGASKGAFHRLAGILHVELGARGIRAYNVDPGLVWTEAQKILFARQLFGDQTEAMAQTIGAPPAVPAAVIAWLATQPEAAAMCGQTIDAQSFCRERPLVPGWPPAR